MSLGSNDRILGVADRLAREVSRISSKEAQRVLGTSETTITKIKRGELPNAATLLRAVEKFGAKILEPVIGKYDEASLVQRLIDLERLIGDIRHAHALPSSNPNCGLGADGRDRDEDVRALVQGAGEAAAQPLAAALAPFRQVIDFSAALAHARAAGNISLGIRRRGEGAYRLAYPARLNRLVPRFLIGRPYVEHPDAKFGRLSQADMEEVEEAGSVRGRREIVVEKPTRIVSIYDYERRFTHTPDGDCIVAAAAMRLEAAA